MLVCLAAPANRKGSINQDFARAFFERFTLGAGRVSEAEVKEAARAFSGWRVDAEAGIAEFDARRHDDGEKMVLGGKGKFDGDQVIDMVLRDPGTAEFIVSNMWLEFVSDQPDRKVVQRLARDFRRNYHIKPLVRGLLLTRAFRDPWQRGRMVKSPLELLMGAARQFHVPVNDGRDIAQTARMLGQDLFDPPVKGWRRGTGWITSSSLSARQQALARLLRDQEQGEEAGKSGIDVNMTPARMAALLLPVPPLDPIPAGLSAAELSVHLVREPAYQLK
jgi:uncharacterized protein (DUF1800 family)